MHDLSVTIVSFNLLFHYWIFVAHNLVFFFFLSKILLLALLNVKTCVPCYSILYTSCNFTFKFLSSFFTRLFTHYCHVLILWFYLLGNSFYLQKLDFEPTAFQTEVAQWFGSNTLGFYSGDAWFESQLGHWMSWQRFFSAPPNKCWESTSVMPHPVPSKSFSVICHSVTQCCLI